MCSSPPNKWCLGLEHYLNTENTPTSLTVFKYSSLRLMLPSHYVTASALCPRSWQKPTQNSAADIWVTEILPALLAPSESSESSLILLKPKGNNAWQFNTSYLQQGCCRIPLQALCQFIHLIQEENGIVHPHSLQPVDDPARHAAHVGAPAKEGGTRVVTQGTWGATSKIAQIKLQAKQKNKEHCNNSCFLCKNLWNTW